jgi:hypothetical protein
MTGLTGLQAAVDSRQLYGVIAIPPLTTGQVRALSAGHGWPAQ